MTKEKFITGMQDLELAFKYALPEESIPIYYKYTKHIDEKDWFKNIITPIIQNEKFFPAIATLLAYKPQLGIILQIKEPIDSKK